MPLHAPVCRAVVFVALPFTLGALVGLPACGSARPNSPQTYPGLTFPARFAEGEPVDSASGSAAAVATPAPSASYAPVGGPPDPEPLRLARQYDFLLRYDRGTLSVRSVRAVDYAKPIVTARRMGRWAIELWIGRELIERVRFDFPLLGAEAVPQGRRRPLKQPPSLATGGSVEQHLLVPASPRATRAVLVDRGTGQRLDLAWPPDAPLGAAISEAPPASSSADVPTSPASSAGAPVPSASAASSASAGE